ncbi:MAG: hypothetical protein U0K68_13125 [Agathobacter sp.]|uniref:hypothetical protein n=1 Tax=Coprococcus phoceensis TaxID=1870993 RepID=UPI002EB88779|nr:hypothetical protein [Lachnospiraceae bacterium]MEE1007553.1 hypothetical protein [Agathobacter sp.]MEE1058473.1 hypothetical protein [Treponema sp.]MEE1255400.1 hypothetical protein [Lachnospiraceae bacterium]MEE1306066.1 hypothetical protein [Agathobacter sp.]
MEKFLNYFKYISLVAGITLLICFVLSFLYGLRGDVYLKIDDKNRSLVSDMCETEDIPLNGKLIQIGCKQGLGDWYLYLYYDDDSSERRILEDTIGFELRMYIRENGQIEGTKGVIVNSLVKVSAFIVGIYIICVLYHRIIEKRV